MASAPPIAPALPDVVEDHLEELGFLAIQRRKLIVDPDTSRSRLAEHEERVAAHREGLQIAGRVAADIAVKRLDEATLHWHVAAAGRIWIEEGAPSPQDVETRTEAGGEPLVAGWREALRRTTPAQVERLFPRAATEPSGPFARQARADARIWHGRASEAAAKLVSDGDGRWRSVARGPRAPPPGQRAVRAAGAPRRRRRADVRRRALWSSARRRAPRRSRARRTSPLRLPTRSPWRILDSWRRVGWAAPRAHAVQPAALRALGDPGASTLILSTRAGDGGSSTRRRRRSHAARLPAEPAGDLPADPEVAR
jgi:hypothetical protein